MINWNEVTVGETELVSPSSRQFLVMARRDGRVWLQNQKTQLDSVHEESVLLDWTIYDPWEEVTDSCSLEKGPAWNRWVLYYLGVEIHPENINFQIRKGLRVWKRKEGYV